MSNDNAQLEGPDLRAGVELNALSDGTRLTGQVDGETAMLVRNGDELFAVGATCTHYGGPLAEGLIEGQTVRCPWHHACFDLRTGEPLRAPALNPIPRWRVEVTLPPGRQVAVAVVGERRPAAHLTCAAPRATAAVAFRVLSIDPV